MCGYKEHFYRAKWPFYIDNSPFSESDQHFPRWIVRAKYP